MNAEAFSSVSPRLPVALIDLVETKTPEENRAFVTRVTQLTEEVGGRRVLANEVIVSMIVSDERASNASALQADGSWEDGAVSAYRPLLSRPMSM